MLMVSMNLSFPQTLSFLLKVGAGLSGSSWLLHPKFQLEFCCEISSAISSSLLRKENTNVQESGTRNSDCLLKRGAASQNFSGSLSRSECIYFVKSLTHAGKGFGSLGLAVFAPGFFAAAGSLPSLKSEDPHPSLPVVVGRPLEEASNDLCGKDEEMYFREQQSEGSGPPGWVCAVCSNRGSSAGWSLPP